MQQQNATKNPQPFNAEAESRTKKGAEKSIESRVR
jgi:hypothetical protein